PRMDLGLPIAEERLGRQDQDRILRKRRVAVDTHLHQDAVAAALERDLLDPADRHAAQLDRVANQQLADLAEPRLELDLLPAEARALQPERADDDHDDPGQDRRADDHVRSLLHTTSWASSGRPSMNARTIGSSELRTSSGVPVNRIRPSCRNAIRSAIRNALSML